MSLNNTKKILIVNDVTGYGRVSTFAMLPIMAKYELHPYVLPTALVSNTMDYGDCEILETTEFIEETIKKWMEFGFKFDAISTGFINSKNQANIVLSLIEKMKPNFLLVDPIMADSGELYPNMNPDAINYYRNLVAKSDICIPNLTEARLLTDMPRNKEYVNDEELSTIINKLSDLGCKDIVITDCKNIDGENFNYVYESLSSKSNIIRFKKINSSFIGTGDVFSAVLCSNLLLGSPLTQAVETASDFVARVISDNFDNQDPYDLIIEKSLKYI